MKYTIHIDCNVVIDVPDPEYIERWVDEQNDRNSVLDHLAFNAVVNGIEDASRLDGWGDLERDQLTMHVDRWSLDYSEPVEES